jgi:outer membrane protein TolC
MNIWVSKKRLQMSELALRFQIINIVTAVQMAYYDLIFAQENVKVFDVALQLAEQQARENKRRVEVGAMAQLDEKQAESQAAARRADLLVAQRTLAAQQNVMKNLLSDRYTEWQKLTLVPSEPLAAVPQAFNLQDSWQKGLLERPDLQQFRVDLERQNIVLRYDRNQLFPQLDLVGSYGHLGSDREFSGTINQIKEGISPFYSYGASFSFPLSNRGPRNNYKIDKSLKQQLLLRLKKLEQDIMVQIEDAVKLAETSYERVQATKQASQYAQEALDAEKKKLDNGKSTSFNVLFLQNELTAARSSEIQALADYNKALAQLALKEGSTLEKNRIGLGAR